VSAFAAKKDIKMWRTDLGIPWPYYYSTEENICEKYYNSRYVQIFKKDGNKIILGPVAAGSETCFLNDLYKCKQLHFTEGGKTFDCDGLEIELNGTEKSSKMAREICEDEMEMGETRLVQIAAAKFIVIKKKAHICTVKSDLLSELPEKTIRCEQVTFTKMGLHCLYQQKDTLVEYTR
jgi:hypothetical protein